MSKPTRSRVIHLAEAGGQVAAGDVNEVTRRLMKALGVPATRRTRKVASGAGGKARKKAPGGRSKVAAAAAARRRNTPQQSAARSAKREAKHVEHRLRRAAFRKQADRRRVDVVVAVFR